MKSSLETLDSDYIIEQLLNEYDDTSMPLPDMVSDPHLLISKVRKHYMEYVIKLLSVNYENNQKLVNKNIYLPSAIWRCAKSIEITAAQTSMVVQLYRKNIIPVIKELKDDTKKGKLNKKLYNFLHNASPNEKKSQTTLKINNCNCQCTCNERKRRRRLSTSPKIFQNELPNFESSLNKETVNYCNKQYALSPSKNTESIQIIPISEDPLITMGSGNQTSNISKPCTRVTINSASQLDELELQLEKLFQNDENDDDLFEDILCNYVDSSQVDGNAKDLNSTSLETHRMIQKQDHATEIDNSLDARLATLNGMLVSNNETIISQQKSDNIKNRKRRSSKWQCEEYFLKLQLFETFDQIRDSNRKKLARIKQIYMDLFGDDSDDDDGVMSPLDETPDFVNSCKERIAQWVLKLLTPYYVKGRIRGKILFKSLARHLIRLIYQCSRYPRENDVCNFVSDFLNNHKMIRCEADFKEFKIENIYNNLYIT